VTVFFRLLTILRVTLRYRLDLLLSARKLPFGVRLLLLPCKLFPKSSFTRGQRLRHALEELGPIFIKFGQLLSTRPDLVPEDIVLELNHLQDNVAPFGNAEFRALVEAALNANVEDIFLEYEHEPLASASVAQVHGAILKDGRRVVIKVVRPGIESVIEQDVALLFWLAKRVERYSADGKRLRPVEIVQDYRITIFDELDLQREAANASQLRRNFANSSLLYVPEIYWDYTRNNVLVMERIKGIPVTDIAALHAQRINMKKLAERGVEIFFTQVFEHNFFHADMHPGNIFVAEGKPDLPQYIAVDMAIVGSLTRDDQFYLARNLLAMFRRDYRQVAELHVQSGWVAADTRVEELEAAVRTVCEPIFEKPLKDISFGHVLLSLFRTARRFNMEVQPQLVLLQKTLVNIEGLGRQLYPELDLWTTAHPYLERWLKDRYHPKSLWAELKRYGPDWMEKFPQVPHMFFDSLKQMQSFGDMAQELEITARQLRDDNNLKRRQRRRNTIALLAFAGAAAIAWPAMGEQFTQWINHFSLKDLPVSSYILIAIGLTALALRKS
jgi:ubiquinone biosynthesis protein